MNKTLIITGGAIDYEVLINAYKNGKFNNVIAVDKGLEAVEKLNIVPNLIIGDFDSVNKKILERYEKQGIKIVKLNSEKDFSDTHMALKSAIELKSEYVCIVGALGNRMDHAIANIHVLKEMLDNKIRCIILDKNNEIELISKGISEVEKSIYKYVSLFPLTTKTTGITLEGFKYPLKNATLEIGHSIGVSNEIIDNIGKIKIKKGILILMKSKD